MKKIITFFIILVIAVAGIPKLTSGQVVSGFSVMQDIGIPGDDFIGSISLSEANLYETDFNSKYLFPMQGICTVSNGKIAVIDNSYGRVHILNSATEDEFTFGSLKTLVYPTDIAFYNNMFYIADPLSGSVKMFNSGGKYLGEFGKTIFNSPIGVAASKEGIYVTDYFEGKLFKLDSNYNVLLSVNVNFPGGLTTDGEKVYAVSMSDRSVYVYDLNLSLIRKISSGKMYFPSDVAVDGSGNVYVSDRGLIKGGDSVGKVLKFSNNGSFQYAIGKPAETYPGQPDGTFLTPCGVAVQNGKVFVMDGGYYYWDNQSDAPFGSSAGERFSVFSDTGIFLSKKDFLQGNGSRLISPTSATLDSHGNIWALSSNGLNGNEIVEFNQSGDFARRIKKVNDKMLPTIFCIYSDKAGHILLGMEKGVMVLNENGEFQLMIKDSAFGNVRKIVKGKDGYFYGTLSDKDAVVKFSVGGKVKGVFPVCKYPSGIAQDRRGDFYITSLDDNKLYEYSNAFKEIRTIGEGGGRGKMNFYVPEDVAVDKYGNIIVADTENGRLSVFEKNGTLIYQSPRVFYEIASVEVEDGILIVADCFHNIIRVISENTEAKQYLFFASAYPQKQIVRSGAEADFQISITNAGSKADNYNIFVAENLSPDWVITLSQHSLSLPPNGNAKVLLTVKTPVNAKDGETATVNITIASPNITKKFSVQVIISTELPPKIFVKDQSVVAGKELEVPVYVDGLSSAEGIAFTLHFPSSGILFEGIQKNGLMKNGLVLSKTYADKVVFAVSLTNGQSVSGSGIVATAKFKASSISQNLVKFSDAYYVNPAGSKTIFDVKAGQITVTPYLFLNFSNGIHSPDQNFTFSGKTTPGAKLVVNGQVVKIGSDGTFTATVVLNSKENLITVSAIAKGGEQTTIQRTVFYSGKKHIVIKFQIGNPMMTVNGIEMEIDPGRGTKPFIVNGWDRTVVPIRAIVESLGGTVGWRNEDKMVWIILDTTTINMWINNPQAKVNGTPVWIDLKNHTVCPIIANDRTFVPVRFVAESLGCTVLWDGKTQTVTITYEG